MNLISQPLGQYDIKSASAGDNKQPPTQRPSTSRLAGCGGLALTGVGLLLLVIVGALLLFGARDGEPAPGGATPSPSARSKDSGNGPTRTPRPSPTATPRPPATATASPTNQPTNIPTDTPRPSSGLVITTDNVHQVEELARLGRGTVNTLALSPDGATLAVAGSLGVWLYDAETLEALGLLEGPTEPVTEVAWSPDSAQLAASSDDGTVRIWSLPVREVSSAGDAAKGSEPHTLRGHISAVASVAWSPDGTQLASGGWDDTIRIWDVTSGRELRILTGHTEAVLSVAWSPDGAQLASGSRDGTVRLWDTVNGREVDVLNGHTKDVNSVAWSPDGGQLASASSDETVRVWLLPQGEADTAQSAANGGEWLVLEGHTSHVQSVTWSPDGTQLASGGLDRTVRVWDAIQGDELWVLEGHIKPVRRVIWASDSAQLMSVGDNGAVRVWPLPIGEVSFGDVTGRDELHLLEGHVDAVLSVAWSPDGTQLASGNEDGTVRIWDATTGLQLYILEGHADEVTSVAWSPDGSQLASAGGVFDGKVLVWLLPLKGPDSAGDAVTVNAPRLLGEHSSAVTSLTWSPDGSKLASASWDGTVRVWDASGGLLHVLEGHTDWVFSVAWSPEGTYLASGGKDGSVRIWPLPMQGAGPAGAQAYVLEGHTEQVMSVAWSPDGTRLASASWDDTLRVWSFPLGGPDSAEDVAVGRELLVLETPGSVGNIVWSPDGILLASVGGFLDNVVRVWDITTGRELRALEGHVDFVNGAAWSPDGTRLASGSDDGTLRVWGIASE